MRQALGTVGRLEAGLGVDPRLVLASRLLQLAQTELEGAVETELQENPALERLEDGLIEPVRDEEVLRRVAPSELRPASEDGEYRRSLPNDETATDPLDFVATAPSLREHLAAQLLPFLPGNLRRVGAYLIECLSDTGYLDEPLEEVALAANCSIEEAEEALRALQACEPAGVGARNVQECLLLQLRGDATVEGKVARAVVRSGLDDLIARRTMRLARRHGVMPDVVEQAFAKVLALNPFPGEAFRPVAAAPEAPRAPAVTPDLSLRRGESGWDVLVHGPEPSSLRVGRAYRRREKELDNLERPPADELRHVGTYVRRAKEFISALEQRRRTMRAIGEYLIKHQMGFVSTGSYAFLVPLTRARLAQELGLHESTVSRATADKFVEIATGEMVPFEVFFKPALRIQKMIEEILSTENPSNPLSDERIAEILAERGVLVARRTVNKYRDRTRLLSSRKRKSA